MLLFSFIILFLSATTPADHDFKMSVCELEYAAPQSAFHIRLYIFQDDLKKGIYDDPDAPRLETQKVVDYILKKVTLYVDDENIPFYFSEIKEKEDQVQVVFISEKITLSPTTRLELINQLLIEKFRTQINMVYLSLPGRSKLTRILNAQKTKAAFSR